MLCGWLGVSGDVGLNVLDVRVAGGEEKEQEGWRGRRRGGVPVPVLGPERVESPEPRRGEVKEVKRGRVLAESAEEEACGGRRVSRGTT